MDYSNNLNNKSNYINRYIDILWCINELKYFIVCLYFQIVYFLQLYISLHSKKAKLKQVIQSSNWVSSTERSFQKSVPSLIDYDISCNCSLSDSCSQCSRLFPQEFSDLEQLCGSFHLKLTVGIKNNLVWKRVLKQGMVFVWKLSYYLFS